MFKQSINLAPTQAKTVPLHEHGNRPGQALVNASQPDSLNPE
jgi:hypothetical protein